MKRREFLTLLAGAGATWPLAARAQQPERIRRIGFLTSLGADDPVSLAYLAGLLQGLQELGWVVGRNVGLDSRWAATNVELKRKYAAELVRLAPDVIVATGDSNTGPLQEATRMVPIVFAWSRTRSAPASLRIWPGLAATQPGSQILSTA
jgi:putative ABC transport system substrate-binding protein